MDNENNRRQRQNCGGSDAAPLFPAALWRPLIIAAGVIVLCLGGTEIAERIWWPNLDDATQHWVHLARGALCSMLVAVAVGWEILKHSPGLLAAPSMDKEWAQGGLSAKGRIHHYARWFIAMRWIAVMLAGLLVFISVQLLHWLPQEAWWPLTGTVSVLAGLNVIYTLLVQWRRAEYALLRLQVYLDLVILTLLLHFSGGIENQLSMMMIFHVLIGGILLSRRECYWITSFGSLLFALMAFGEWADIIGHYKLELFPHIKGMVAHHTLYVSNRALLQAVVLFLTAFFVTTLAERLRENERRLERLAGQALASERLLEQALETTRAGLRVVDHELRPYWENAQWRQWSAGPPEQHPVFDLSSGAAVPARQTLQDGQIRVTELVMEPGSAGAPGVANQDCSQHVFQLTTAPLRDLSGNIERIAELAQDVTQQKQAQAQLLRAGQLAAVGQLAGQVAHEVNNPTALISGKARLLLADHRAGMSPKVAEELSKIIDYADRVASITQRLLSYCRPPADSRVALDLHSPIRKSLAMIEPRARRCKITIDDQLPEGELTVRVNGNEMEQVFLNLFLNALDAMPQGGCLKVYAPDGQVRLRDGGPAAAVVVADTGIGIPESIRKRIFEPFFTTKPEGRGTGLGLSICRGLLQAHGGEIEVQTTLGTGTAFMIKLPKEPSPGKETGQDE